MPGNPLVPADPRLRIWSCASLLAKGLDHIGKGWPQDWAGIDRLAVALILERDDVVAGLGYTIEQGLDLIRAEIGASPPEIREIIDDLWALCHATQLRDLARLR